MRRPVSTVFAVTTALLVAGCGASAIRIAALDDMERARGAPASGEAAKLAPEAYARAEQERRIALEEHAAGDDVGAVLHAQRAVAAYEHALAVVRLALATTELADAQKALDDATTELQTVEASRAQLEHEAAELDERVRLSRERLLPASSGPATGEREEARLVAARALAVEAQLLCGAARLVAADAAGLADADGEAGKLDHRLSTSPRPAPIDEAARVRARCLDVLTRARRAAGDDAGASDALLSELSASGGWDPARDERGVVVTLHDAFHGAELGPDAATRLKDLGRVAAAHPGFAVQVVVHDAVGARDDADARRAGAAVQALVAGGAAAGHIRPELAGTRSPLVDPGDAKRRGRNERLDVVFVASGK
ncbi:MAG: hypothetical protein ABSE49_21865 [Polyangiaceae bacterium]